MTFMVVKDSEEYRFYHHDGRALDVSSIRWKQFWVDLTSSKMAMQRSAQRSPIEGFSHVLGIRRGIIGSWYEVHLIIFD